MAASLVWARVECHHRVVRRAYAILCDNILHKLTRRIPNMAAETAPLVSAYLSALSQHRDLSKAARPDGFIT